MGTFSDGLKIEKNVRILFNSNSPETDNNEVELRKPMIFNLKTAKGVIRKSLRGSFRLSKTVKEIRPKSEGDVNYGKILHILSFIKCVSKCICRLIIIFFF